jgi:hypothetical protein
MGTALGNFNVVNGYVESIDLPSPRRAMGRRPRSTSWSAA